MKPELLVAAALALAASGAGAQEAPPPPATAPAAPEPVSPSLGAEAELNAEDDPALEDEIVVLANPADQVRIDRRTYVLRDDPAAQATDMFDVLGRIPAVSVAPSGAVTLLGAANVAVQINGQPVQGDLEQVLRGLNGADVERIEVITNPSAAFSAQASGGIINIITRSRFEAGLNGSVRIGADNLDTRNGGVSASWTGGPWTLSGHAGGWRGAYPTDITRTRETLVGAPLIAESGVRYFDYQGAYARLEAGYRFDERQRLTLAATGFRYDAERLQTIASSDIAGPLSTQTITGPSSYESTQIVADYQRDGLRPREQLKFNIAYEDAINDAAFTFTRTPTNGAPPSQHLTTSSLQRQDLDLKLDVVRPLGDERLFSYGAAYKGSDQDIRNALDPVAGAAPQGYEAALDGRQETTSLYATYQFATGPWTWLPGARVENYRREVISAGLETDDNDVRVFPTLHIRRDLSEALVLDLSYSSRIQHADLMQLDPAVRFFEIDRASSGNPALRPTTTDAFEVNLTYQRRQSSISLTLFDRISEDIISNRTDVTPEGVILSQPVNAGTSEQRGAQAILRGPIRDGWRYSLSGNVLNREFDVLQGAALVRRDEIEYDGVAQLEYREADQSAVGADHLQLELRFQGPRYGLQSESEEFVITNVTWRRRLTPSIFAVFSVNDLFDANQQRSVTTTEDYIERTQTPGPGPRIRFSLTYQFGSRGERTMQDQSQPSSPGQ